MSFDAYREEKLGQVVSYFRVALPPKRGSYDSSSDYVALSVPLIFNRNCMASSSVFLETSMSDLDQVITLFSTIYGYRRSEMASASNLEVSVLAPDGTMQLVRTGLP